MKKLRVILPLHAVHPHLTEDARFCLDMAKQYAPTAVIHIAVLSLHAHKSYPALSGYDHITTWTLDTQLWPQDMANNHLIWPAMTAYQGLKSHALELQEFKIFTPLREGLAYFILQAQKSGLMFDALDLTQTVYKPIGLETSARLQLPLNIDPLVSDSLERWCALQPFPLISTHETTHRYIEHWAGHRLPHLTALPITPSFKELTPDSAAARHLIFIGTPSPVDGFDAFCDLAAFRAEQKNLEKITLILYPSNDKLGLKNKALSRLRSLSSHGVNIDHIEPTEEALHSVSEGSIILPSRLACFPQSLRHLESKKFTFIWGLGLTLDPDIDSRPNGAYQTQSDVRRIMYVLENGHSVENKAAYPRASLPAISARSSKFNSKKISIIVLHKDRLDLLKETLVSLKAQTLESYELVLVDDGSNAKTREILPDLLSSFNFPESQLILLEGLYPGEARNQGAQAATGDTLFFMDDDNCLAPETLADFSRALMSNEIIMSFYQRLLPGEIIAKGTSVNPTHHSHAYGFIGPHPSVGLFHNMMGNSFIMIRKAAYEKLGGYTPEYGIGLEDYAFMRRAAALDFAILPEPYLHFREHGEKIRLTHIDWRSDIRLQAGQWRLMQELPAHALSPLALGYARQLHEIIGQQYVPHKRPRYFNLKTVLLHQYIRPVLRSLGLRRPLQKIAARNGPIYRLFSRFIFRGRL